MKKGIKKKRKRRISLLMTAFMITSTILPIVPIKQYAFAASDEPGEVTYETTQDYQHHIYANGQPLLIVASETNINYAKLFIDSNGNGIGESDEEITSFQGSGTLDGGGIYYSEEQGGYFLTNSSIYGGAKDGVCTYNTNITLTGATDTSDDCTVWALYGGNQNGTLIGDTHVHISGGNILWTFGGNRAGEIDGNTYIDMDGGHMVNKMYGGNCVGRIHGNTNIDVQSAVVSSVFGGNENSGTVEGNTALTFGENTIANGWIYGGGAGYDNSVISEVAGSTTITINGGLFNHNIYGGGGWRGATVGSSNIIINDGTFNGCWIYGGGEEQSSVTGKATITLNNGYVPTIVGTGAAFNNYDGETTIAEVGEAEIHLKGGSVDYVYSQMNENTILHRDFSFEAVGDTFSNTYLYFGQHNTNNLQNVSITLKDTNVALLHLSSAIENTLSITFDNASVLTPTNFQMKQDVLKNAKESTLSYLNCGSKEGRWGVFQEANFNISGNDNPVLIGYYLNHNQFTNVIFKDSYVNYYDFTLVDDDNGPQSCAQTLTIDGGALRVIGFMITQMPKTIFQNNPILIRTTHGTPLHFNEIPEGVARVQWLDYDGEKVPEQRGNSSIVEAPKDTLNTQFVSAISDYGLKTDSCSRYTETGEQIWFGTAWCMDTLQNLCKCEVYSSNFIQKVFAFNSEEPSTTVTLKDIYTDLTSSCPVTEHNGKKAVFTYSILSEGTTIPNVSIENDQLTVDGIGWVHVQIEQNMNGKVGTYDCYVKFIKAPKEDTFTFVKGMAEDITLSFYGDGFSRSFSYLWDFTEHKFLDTQHYTELLENDTFEFTLKKDYLNGLELGEYRFEGNVPVMQQTNQFGAYTYPFTIHVENPTEVENPTIELSEHQFSYDGTAKEPFVVVKDGDIIIPSSEYDVSYENNINVGTANVIITDKVGGNYIVNGSATFEIINEYQPANGVDYIAVLNNNGWTNEDFVITANDGYLLSTGNTLNDEWVTSFTKTEETDKGSITFYVKNIETGEISLAVTESYKIDKTSPEQYDITFNENSVKKFLHTISFGLFFKENIDVCITAQDSLSGIDDIVYFKSQEILTEEQLKTVTEWVSANQFSITANDRENFIIYVKVTDQAGNIVCFASDGTEFDLTSPVITGVKDGEVYYTTQKVEVTDKNIDIITVNGEVVSGNISLVGNADKTYVIKAVDKAKNETVVTITMKPISSLADSIKDITEDNVTSADKQTLLAVNTIDIDMLQASEEEKSQIEAIINKCNTLLETIAAIEKELLSVENRINQYDIAAVTSNEEAEIKALIQDIDALLQSNNLTEEEKSAVEHLKMTATTLIQVITTAQEALNAEEIKAVENITEATVNSSDNAVLEKAKSMIESILKEYGNHYTEKEKQDLQHISALCDKLLAKVAEVQKEFVRIETAINNYDVETVTLNDALEIEVLMQDIEVLLLLGNLTKEEINVVNDLKTTAAKLMDVVSTAQEALNAEEIKAVENITEAAVNSSDNAALEKAKSTIESILKEYGSHYTEKEKQDLQHISALCDKLLAKVAEVQKEFVRIETAINQYNIEAVTSNDTSKIEVLMQDIEVLLQSSNLTEKEKSAVSDLKTTATKLMDVVSTVQEALNAEEIKVVEGISKDTIKLTDKEALEKAKIALETVLSKYNNHYTQAEKQEIHASITCITEALESIQKIQTTMDFISKLPSADNVSPDDMDIEIAAKQANDMLESMTEYEKSFVDTKNLEAVWKALLDYKMLEGDGSKWTKDSNGSITFKANGSVQKLKSIFIDEKLVDKESYTIKEGSTIITLKEHYLNTLSVGNHRLTIHYLDGKTSAAFEIEAGLSDDENNKPDDSSKPEDDNKKPDDSKPEDNDKKPDISQPEDDDKKSDAPQSGDKNNFLLWITLFFISGIGMIGKIVYSTKKK